MPIPFWAGRYIGLPFKDHGRERRKGEGTFNFRILRLHDIFALAALAVIVALLYWAEGRGRKSAENEDMKQVLDDIEKANAARDDILRDADAARRMRERFTRELL